MKNQKEISVCMITYKHEKYIAEAINGVLMQECKFDFELIIADDNSPDNTFLIINEIIKNHPNGSKIKYFKHSANIRMQNNSTFVFSKAKAKYIALCEGDDYWTDPLKLQKQFEFMEANSEYSCVFHDSIIVDENNNYISDFIHDNIHRIYR